MKKTLAATTGMALKRTKRGLEARKRRPMRKVLLAMLENVCKEYIKLRDKRKNNGMCVFNCGRPIQCWFHFIKQSRSLKTRFDERNIVGACMPCNGKMENGEGWAWLWYEKTFGREQHEEIERLSHGTAKFSLQDLENMIADYKAKIERICVS